MYYSKIAGNSMTLSTQKLDGSVWEVLPADRLMLVKEGYVYALSGQL